MAANLSRSARFKTFHFIEQINGLGGSHRSALGAIQERPILMPFCAIKVREVAAAQGRPVRRDQNLYRGILQKNVNFPEKPRLA
jgi:hypothetical protein